MSILVIEKNRHYRGSGGAAFAAIWSALLVIFYAIIGSRAVFSGSATPLMTGFLLGFGAMLCQLFFVLMIYFFVLGSSAAKSNFGE